MDGVKYASDRCDDLPQGAVTFEKMWRHLQTAWGLACVTSADAESNLCVGSFSQVLSILAGGALLIHIAVAFRKVMASAHGWHGHDLSLHLNSFILVRQKMSQLFRTWCLSGHLSWSFVSLCPPCGSFYCMFIFSLENKFFKWWCPLPHCLSLQAFMLSVNT